jgi:hypothetical protein
MATATSISRNTAYRIDIGKDTFGSDDAAIVRQHNGRATPDITRLRASGNDAEGLRETTLVPHATAAA